MYAQPYGSAPEGANQLDPSGKYKIKSRGAYMACEVEVRPGDDFKSEGGAMISMSNNIGLTTHIEGTCFTALCRSCCAGEGFFFSDYASKDGQPGDVLIAPSLPGEIVCIPMDGSLEWTIQKGSYLCCDPGIEIGYTVQGCCNGLGSGEGFILLKATGAGRLVLNSYGSIIRYDLAPGEQRVIDNGALVAWSSNTSYTMGLASQGGNIFGNALRSYATGEGFVCRFTGPGTIFVQTRSLMKLAQQMWPYIPENKKPKPPGQSN